MQSLQGAARRIQIPLVTRSLQNLPLVRVPFKTVFKYGNRVPIFLAMDYNIFGLRWLPFFKTIGLLEF